MTGACTYYKVSRNRRRELAKTSHVLRSPCRAACNFRPTRPSTRYTRGSASGLRSSWRCRCGPCWDEVVAAVALPAVKHTETPVVVWCTDVDSSNSLSTTRRVQV